MRKLGALAVLAASLAVAAPAAAATTIWSVQGVLTPMWPGDPLGQLNGTFTTDDDGTDVKVIALDLHTTAAGAFVAVDYTQVSEVDADWFPQYFRVTLDKYELRLDFPVGFDGRSTTPVSFGGYEAQPQDGSGNRLLQGTATPGGGASVPEPRTWALLIGGFALTGAALRRRSRTLPA